MKRNEIIQAARAFTTNHQPYMLAFAGAWRRGCWEYVKTHGELPYSENLAHDVNIPDWEKLTAEQTVELFQNFWEGLPDDGSIRRAGFNELCDIAENIFGFDDEEDG